MSRHIVTRHSWERTRDLCVHLHLVPDHLLRFPDSVSFPGLFADPRVACYHKDHHSTNKHSRLKPTLDPWPYLLQGPPVFSSNCVTYPEGHFSEKPSLCGFFNVRSHVSVAAQRAVSLFSLTEPQVGGPDLRPVISPVQFHTPQTPRTTPTFSG